MSDNNKETADYSNITEAKPIAFSEADKLEKYKFPIGLEQAIETAILLGQPLFITGEPGNGKTQAAHKLKSILNVDIFQFHTKSTSTVQDLLYQYDIMQHYADKNIENKVDVKTESYIRKSAFYNAIEYQNNNPDKQCVVLIDEIDKAPRDFPNDLLHEMEKYSFNIKEISQEFKLNEGALKPIIIITSNTEKTMPDAFMRRCVFHHIEFNKSILDGIVNIYDKDDKLQSNKENITKLFTDIRGINGLNKKPGIAEFISWIVVVSQGKQYNDSVLMNVLLKNQSDINLCKHLFLDNTNQEDPKSKSE